MANEHRVRANFQWGTITNSPLLVGGTTLTSAELANLPAVGSNEHLAITLDPGGLAGAPEIVWVTAHTASSTSATILRGQEGTAARQHNSGTRWAHSATTADLRNLGPFNLLSADHASFERHIPAMVTLAGSAATFTRSTAQALVGTASMAMTMGGTTTTTVASGPLIRVTPSTQYTVITSFRAATTGRSVNTGFRWFNAALAELNTSTGVTASDTTTGWIERTHTDTSPATAAYAGLCFHIVTPAAGEVHYVDRVAINAGNNVAWDAPLGVVDAYEATPGTSSAVARADHGHATLASPPGMVSPFAGASAPEGWLLCDGVAVSRTEYARLFGVIGTTYGTGDGSTTFNVPNLKGRVVVGLDATQTEFDARGDVGGAKTHTLVLSEMASHNHGTSGGTFTSSQNSNHTHAVTVNGNNFNSGGQSSNHAHAIRTATLSSVSWDGQGYPAGDAHAGVQTTDRTGQLTWGGTVTGCTTLDTNNVYQDHVHNANHSHTASSTGDQNTHDHSLTAQGGGGAHNNLPPFLVLHYIIKF